MLNLVGDETEDTIELPNGMIIKIDYGDENFDTYGIESRYQARNRRVRLFHEDMLISEVVEENPHKCEIPEGSLRINSGKDVIY